MKWASAVKNKHRQEETIINKHINKQQSINMLVIHKLIIVTNTLKTN